MRKRIMSVALGAALAAVGGILMSYTSHSSAMAFVGAGLNQPVGTAATPLNRIFRSAD